MLAECWGLVDCFLVFSLTHTETVRRPSIRKLFLVIASPHRPLVGFFRNLPELLPQWSSCALLNMVPVHQQIWPPLAIFEFHRYRISSKTTGRRDRVAEQLALPTSDQGVTGSNPAGGEILPNLNGASLHRAFHVHPPIVSK